MSDNYEDKANWRAARAEDAAKIDQINLTDLQTEIMPNESPGLCNRLTEQLTAINDMAKPGGGLELTIGRDGYVKWEHYRTESYEGEPIEIWMEAKDRYNRLRIRVPKGLRVVIEEVTKLP